MLVRAMANCDAVMDGAKKALFRGQVYDLPPEAAQPLLDAGLVAAPSGKAVHGPPADKALKANDVLVPRGKATRRRK